MTTYRYLRLALVVLVVLLAAAVVIEWWHTGATASSRCLQTSISAYYYTPARPVLVGVLVAVAACLVCLKGADDREDVLLNLGGMAAPVVAFVPTPDAGTCRSVPVPLTDTSAYVDNNVGALLVAGALGVVVTLVVVLGRRRNRTRAKVVGTLVSVVAVVATGVWFTVAPTSFGRAAHYTAAIGLFGVFIVVVWLNARDLERSRGRRRVGVLLGLRTRYAAVAVAMVVVPLAMWVYDLVVGWDHVLLGVETVLIGLFAVFWLLQTAELGDLSSRA